MTDTPPGSRDSVDTIHDSVLQGGCLLCGGELLGRKDHYFVCTSCNHLFSGERLSSVVNPFPESPNVEVREVVVVRDEVGEVIPKEVEEEREDVRENIYYRSAFSRNR